MSELVRAELEDGVLIVRMQDEAGNNAFSAPFLQELRGILAEEPLDPQVRVVLLCGLPDIFCSGAPVELLRELVESRLSPDDLILPREMLSLPVPCIAAMGGHATGGGLALGLCADFAVFARQSRYGANFMNMGFTPGMGMTRLLEHFLPPAVAHEMLFTGAYYKGSFLEQCHGLARVADRGEVEAVAMDLALQIADKPRKALELLKKTLATPRLQAYELALKEESLMHQACFAEDEIRLRIEDYYVE